jgi:hypothetical protein
MRRLVISVCGRERGTAVLPIERGLPARRLDATAIRRELQGLVARRGLSEQVTLCDACAGGCHGAGPNVSVTVYPVPPPGERPSHVAVGWKTYVTSLASLDCLARIIDENLGQGNPPATSRGRPRAR